MENKLWKTLIRFEKFNKKKAFIVIPSWDHSELVEIQISDIPEKIISALKKEKLPFRCYAKVNIDNENKNELFFKKWELPGNGTN